jgi:hypothetical protein
MTRALSVFTALLVSSLLVGCMPAPVGAAGFSSVPTDGASQCADQCGKMGLRLSAVAVMANHVGCVCEVPPAGGQVAPASAGKQSLAPAGMATLALLAQAQADEEQRRQNASAQQQQQRRR